jgi:ABC-2 type transport system permease protein
MFVLTNLALLIPGEAGEWVVKLMPGNTVSAIGTPVMFNPQLLGAWAGFGVFMAEAAAVMLFGWYLLRRRDA